MEEPLLSSLPSAHSAIRLQRYGKVSHGFETGHYLAFSTILTTLPTQRAMDTLNPPGRKALKERDTVSGSSSILMSRMSAMSSWLWATGEARTAIMQIIVLRQ